MALTPGTATRTRFEQPIAADPTSTALLLAGPTAMELWPGLRRVGLSSGRVVVEADLGDQPAAASVRALPPKRTPTCFVTRFEFVGPGLPATTAELTLAYAPKGTHAELVLTSSGFEGTVLDEVTLAEHARGFLANLARAAELRSCAA